jgi:hypothetical protein
MRGKTTEEVGMKNKTLLLTALFLVPMIFGCAGNSSGPDALAEKIQKASSLLLGSDKSADKEQGFLLLVESIDLAAAGGGFPAGFQGEIRGALDLCRQGSILDQEAGEKLRKAYALLTEGRSFQMPAEISSIDQAVEYGRTQIKSALDKVNAGKNADAVKPLLEVILMVITPMVAPGW